MLIVLDNLKHHTEQLLRSKKYSKSNKIITASNIERLTGVLLDKFIIDEYLLMANAEGIYNYIAKYYPTSEILIYATADKIYNSQQIEIVKEMKRKAVNPAKITDIELLDLYQNFLTEPNIELYIKSGEEDVKLKNILSDAEYNLTVLNLPFE